MSKKKPSTHKTIAADTKCSVSTVKRAIQELVKKGFACGILDLEGLREAVLGWETARAGDVQA